MNTALAAIPAPTDGRWCEAMIANALARVTFDRRAVVLVDRCTWTGHECDLLVVTRCLRVIDVEIKISRADLKADAKKAKWWTPRFDQQREHPPHVWKHYYCMPEAVWGGGMPEVLPSEASGVIVLRAMRGGSVAPVVVRRAKPSRGAKRLTPAEVLDIARLANLRMWDAYARAEQDRRLAEDGE